MKMKNEKWKMENIPAKPSCDLSREVIV